MVIVVMKIGTVLLGYEHFIWMANVFYVYVGPCGSGDEKVMYQYATKHHQLAYDNDSV